MKRMTDAEKAAALEAALAATQPKPVASCHVEADGTVVVTLTTQRRTA
jgi:hypothetical protein